jgi:hypothetical protein
MSESEDLQAICGRVERGEVDSAQFLEEFTRFLAAQIGCTRAAVRVLVDTPDGRALRSIAMYDANIDRMVRARDLYQADGGPYFERLLSDGGAATMHAQTDPTTAAFAEDYLIPAKVSSLMDACFWVNGTLYGTFSCEQTGTPLDWTARQQQTLRRIAVRTSLTLMHVVTASVDTAPGALWESSTPNRLATMPMPLDPEGF